jgi:predicted transcriptional regulator
MPPPQAQVTSVEAVEAFRAALVVFRGKARTVLGEVSEEVLRTRLWVQDDRRRHWTDQMRGRTRQLERARGELFNATLSSLQTPGAAQHLAVQRAERAVAEAEAKLAVLKKWNRDLENRTSPLLKQVEQLQGWLTTDMARAVAHLAQVVQTLDAYAGVAAPGGPAPAAPAPAGATEGTGHES